jgi:hypothetical protein
MYNAEVDDVTKSTLGNVNETWSQYDCVIVNTAIVVLLLEFHMIVSAMNLYLKWFDLYLLRLTLKCIYVCTLHVHHIVNG